MKPVDILKSPLWAAELATGAKSFCDNPIIGSRRLNARGLHVGRVRLAQQMSDWRRRRLASFVPEDMRANYDRDGYLRYDNVLSETDLAGLRAEVEQNRFHAWDMKQGNAVTRFIPLPPSVLRDKPCLNAFVNSSLFRKSLQYVASTNADPIVYLHIVLTNPQKGRPDPQTHFHSDTFQPTSKSWFFLYDVPAEEGPFTYVPGSHKLTAERARWEQLQSEEAATNKNRLHARGSFRATADEIRQMGFGDPVPFAVPGNTYVVADTHGFHARGPSVRPSVRVGIYGSLRRNPFLPFTGLAPFTWPGLYGRQALLHMKTKDLRKRYFNTHNSHQYVGAVLPTDPSPR
ncbi:phytanoyl-CoA dioxygenase family protein [Roseibium sp. RKSG952]|uniref:phytanoyl-CoA dioxygenase family protein n=1 Tax=Roseibium sp. RKSG952 TaxID=2529384 RepID=UPI0012BC4E17|nr:phytanoyl-CoA dioxygenase family protein [Roseibium sp. RKSG952]MTH97907.1 phytanoyl-CoA dioxygenase [Roseibium sp. RKSG952]